jgi:diguanylate cyclase (GGDEF)-like protein/PAS domain S-box-containing protein
VSRLVRFFGRVTLRTKLVLVLLLVESGALGFFAWQNYLLDLGRAEFEFQGRISQMRPLLNAAIAPALRARDLPRLQDVLANASNTTGLRYLVVSDASGRRIASVGAERMQALPPPDSTLADAASDGRFDTQVGLALDGEPLGMLHFGVSTDRSTALVREQLNENLFIAGAVFLMTVLSFLVVVHLLTRRLTLLRRASERIASGDYAVKLPEGDADDVGKLACAFNRMAQVVHERIEDLESSRQKFHNIADYTYDVECWFSPTGELLWINSSVERLTGYTAKECMESRSFPAMILHPDDCERALKASRHALKAHTTGADFEFRIVRKDGEEVWLTNNWQPIYDQTGEFLGLRSSLNSIQQLKDTELSLRLALTRIESANALQASTASKLNAERSRLLSLLSAMSFGVVFIDRAQRIIYSNPAFAEVWSVPGDEALLGLNLFDALQKAEDVVQELGVFSARLSDIVSNQLATSNTEIKLMSGRTLRLQVYPVLDETGECMGSVLIHEDITAQREAEGQLAFLAERDPLTGLYNRRRFERELADKIEDAMRAKQKLALFFFDMDEFKSVNDLFGHRMGDTVLMQVAGEIRSHLRKNEFFARIGGDEFALLVSDVSEASLRALAERLMQVISGMSFALGEVKLSLTSSLGIALFPDHAANPQELIAHADAAMYQAKDAGKNIWRIYRPDHIATLRQRSLVTWNDRIRQALRTDGFDVYVQGVFGCDDRVLRHHEALLRMHDGTPGRVLAPGQFINFAEKSNLIIDIDHWMIQAVIAELAKRPMFPAIAVNVSGRSFDEPDMADFIAGELKRAKVNPGRLYVEITETAAIRDMRDAQRFIEQLHAIGCKVCLDDFGAGFSTFAYIKQLPVDVLKIDGLFTRNLARDRDNQVFVKAMLDIARGFGKQVVAEAVEDESSFNLLASYGVDMAQGFILEVPHLIGSRGPAAPAAADAARKRLPAQRAQR